MSFVEEFRANGCLTITRLFDPDFITKLCGETLRQYAKISVEALPPHLAVGHRRVQLPIAMSGPLLDPTLYANPLLLPMLSVLLGPDFLIDSFSCVVAFAGAEDQPLHRDHGDLFAEDEIGQTLYPYAITVAVPLIDLTIETGTTKLFPGSHRLASDDAKASLSAARTELPYLVKGGCYLMDYRLWHQGMANRSKEPRPILYLIYARSWFTDMENFQAHPRILIDAGDFASIPAGHRRLFRRLAAKGGIDQTELRLVRDGVPTK